MGSRERRLWGKGGVDGLIVAIRERDAGARVLAGEHEVPRKGRVRELRDGRDLAIDCGEYDGERSHGFKLGSLGRESRFPGLKQTGLLRSYNLEWISYSSGDDLT